ncbi:kinase-like domain-containing protein [Chytridium lagenaria]|nr:kinase-like domain-containing protein [Chytridium lagenaria]
MWSSGCIMAEMLLRKPIFPGNDEISQLDHIWKVCGTPTEESWPGIESMPWWNMMRPKQVLTRCLREMMKRLIVGEGFKLLDSLLQMDPSKRPSAAEALVHPYFTDELPRPCSPSDLPKSKATGTNTKASSAKRAVSPLKSLTTTLLSIVVVMLTRYFGRTHLQDRRAGIF